MTVQDLVPIDIQVDVWAVLISGIDETLALIEKTPGETAWLVHQSRKAGKRWRSYLHMVEGAGETAARHANLMIRDACRGLSTARDNTARLECLMLLEAATQQSDAKQDIVKLRRSLADYRSTGDEAELLRQFAADIRNIKLYLAQQGKEQGQVALGRGLARSTARVVKSWHRATRSTDPELLHEWRKKVQRLKYQLRLPKPNARHASVERLSDCLGEIHDLDVLADFLETFDQAHSPCRYGRVLDAAELYRGRLHAEAFRIASDMFAVREAGH